MSREIWSKSRPVKHKLKVVYNNNICNIYVSVYILTLLVGQNGMNAFVAVVYHNYNEVVEPIIQLFSIITSQLLCYLSEVCADWS